MRNSSTHKNPSSDLLKGTPYRIREIPRQMGLRVNPDDPKPLFLLNYGYGKCWAYPNRRILVCFQKALMPLPANLMGMINFMKHASEQWSLRKETTSQRSKRKARPIEELSWDPKESPLLAFGALLYDLLESKGAQRTRKCKDLKLMITDALDLLVADGFTEKHPKKQCVSIAKCEIPLGMLRFDRLSRYRYEPTFIEWSTGASTAREAQARNLEHTKNSSIIELPIECVAVEYARRFVQEHERLPLKKEVRDKIEEAHPNDAQGLSDSFWSKVWISAGLEALQRDSKW